MTLPIKAVWLRGDELIAPSGRSALPASFEITMLWVQRGNCGLHGELPGERLLRPAVIGESRPAAVA
jgi:hypothetical protein